MSDTPLASVIIPTYNRSEILPRAIESVLNQTFTDFELIVVDDGSTDNTESVVRSYNDNRIRFVKQQNCGANSARNNGIRHATGKYISFLDSDDKFAEKYLTTVIGILCSNNNQPDGVLTPYQTDYRTTAVNNRMENKLVEYSEIINRNVVIGFSGLTVRSSIFKEIQLDENLPSFQDYDFVIRLYDAGFTLRSIKEPLVIKYKDESDRISSDPTRRIEGAERIFEKHYSKLTNKAKAQLHYLIALAHTKNNDLSQARLNFKKTIQHEPTRWLAYIHYVSTIHPQLSTSFMKIKRFGRKSL